MTLGWKASWSVLQETTGCWHNFCVLRQPLFKDVPTSCNTPSKFTSFCTSCHLCTAWHHQVFSGKDDLCSKHIAAAAMSHFCGCRQLDVAGALVLLSKAIDGCVHSSTCTILLSGLHLQVCKAKTQFIEGHVLTVISGTNAGVLLAWKVLRWPMQSLLMEHITWTLR